MMMMMMCRYCRCIWFDWWCMYVFLSSVCVWFASFFVSFFRSSSFYCDDFFCSLIFTTTCFFAVAALLRHSRLFAVNGFCLFGGTLNTISTILNTVLRLHALFSPVLFVTQHFGGTTFIISICLFFLVLRFFPLFGSVCVWVGWLLLFSLVFDARSDQLVSRE